jgi:uncharacterized membrane protein
VIVRSKRIWRNVAAHAFVIAVLPLTFVLVLFIWHEIDRYHGRHEVAEFIVRHSEVVQHRLTDPHVHSFSLKHDPDDPSTLLIEFDVEDKATYHMLEDDLGDWVKLKFIPVWNTTLRSNEDLGNDFGAMGAGIGAVMEGLIQCGVAAIVSFCTFLVALTFLRIIHAPEEKNREGEQNAEPELPITGF